jgi:hypothetical protein
MAEHLVATKIYDMANTLRQYADQLDRKAKDLSETCDDSIVAAVVEDVANLYMSLQLGTLVSRTIRNIKR